MTNPFKKILLTTLGVHLCCIIYLTIESTPPPTKNKQKKVAVNTVSLKQKKPEVKQSAPQKVAAKPVKEEAPQKVAKEKPAQKIAKEKAPQPKKNNSELLSKAKKALAKMEKVEAHSNQASQEEESDYSEELVKRLKLQMHLPEFGQVEVLLTLERSGKVSSVEVTDTKSRWNKKYVENTLPTLLFPDFGKWYPKEDKHTFTLTLSNELD